MTFKEIANNTHADPYDYVPGQRIREVATAGIILLSAEYYQLQEADS